MKDKNPAAVALGRLGGLKRTPAQQAARAENARKGGRPSWRSGPYAPRLHRDGDVTYWSVYQHVWMRGTDLSDRTLASFTADERAAVERHIARHRALGR